MLRAQITDGATPATNLDQLSAIAEEMKNRDYRLNILGLGFSDDEPSAEESEEGAAAAAAAGPAEAKEEKKPVVSAADGRTKAMVDNEKVMRDFCAQFIASVSATHSSLDAMVGTRSKSVGQVTKFRGPLEFSPALSIPVYVYSKTLPRPFSTMKKMSQIAYDCMHALLLPSSFFSLFMCAFPPSLNVRVRVRVFFFHPICFCSES